MVTMMGTSIGQQAVSPRSSVFAVESCMVIKSLPLHFPLIQPLLGPSYASSYSQSHAALQKPCDLHSRCFRHYIVLFYAHRATTV